MHSQWWTAADAYTLDKVDKVFDRHRWTDNKPSVKDSSYFTIITRTSFFLPQLTLTSSQDTPESSVVLLNPQQLKVV